MANNRNPPFTRGLPLTITNYRPEELAKEIIKVLAKVTAQTQSVIIATRKGTWQRIAGQKGEAEKDRDQRARKDQIGQDTHIKLEKIL
jgi:hypothetical protein